jgi:membrane-associated phospholipid phosphatase
MNRFFFRKYLSLHLLVGLAALMLGVILFGLMARAVVNENALVQFDRNFAITMRAWALQGLTPVMLLTTSLGFQVLIGIVGIVAFILYRQRRWTHLIVWSIAWGGGELLNQLLKQIFLRPRPVFDEPLLTATNYSFPSGHAMMSIIVYGLLAYFVLLDISHPLKRIAVLVLTIVLVLAIGFSRIYLGVHYFSDVVGGFAVGLIWLTICISGMDFILRRHRPAVEAESTDNAVADTQ